MSESLSGSPASVRLDTIHEITSLRLVSSSVAHGNKSIHQDWETVVRLGR